MSSFRRQKVDNTNELNILIGVITSTHFIKEIRDSINLDYFIDPQIKKIVRWCLNHYDKTDSVPDKAIQSIFSIEKTMLEDDEAELIEKLLIMLSNKCDEVKFNVDYWLEKTFEYFKSRALTIIANNALQLIEQGQIKDAEDQISNYKKIERTFSEWINPISVESFKKIMENRDRSFFKLSGDVGRFVGGLEAGWLIGIEGKFKGCKTWIQQEFVWLGAMSRMKSVLFSLEMTSISMAQRIVQRALSVSKYPGKKLFPTFDCGKHQTDVCRDIHRTDCSRLIKDSVDRKSATFGGNANYRPCTYCRYNNTFEFEPTVWFFESEVKGLDDECGERIERINQQYGQYIRVKNYPRFSASVANIKRDLDILERTEGFIPDIIVIDYIDILRPEEKSIGTEKEDQNWMALARLAGEYHALVVTGTQVDRDGNKDSTVLLKSEHTAKWIGKRAHVDVMLTLNQVAMEKQRGVLRMGMMDHRHEDFNPLDTCIILQQLDVGQVCLDSFWAGKINR